MSVPPPHIERIEWDDWNRDHIAKHDVSPEEVQEMLVSAPVFQRTYKQRFQALGPTLAGCILSVIVGAHLDQPAIFYVFSTRPASRSERRIYGDLQGEVNDQ